MNKLNTEYHSVNTELVGYGSHVNRLIQTAALVCYTENILLQNKFSHKIKLTFLFLFFKLQLPNHFKWPSVTLAAACQHLFFFLNDHVIYFLVSDDPFCLHRPQHTSFLHLSSGHFNLTFSSCPFNHVPSPSHYLTAAKLSFSSSDDAYLLSHALFLSTSSTL